MVNVEQILEMFWIRLHKQIIKMNDEKGKNFYSENKNDYSFVSEEKKGSSMILSFKDNKHSSIIELNVKVIK